MIELKAHISVVKLHGKAFIAPGGGTGGALQNKSVIPTTEPIIVTADPDYYGLSAVTVEALPSAENNTFGGDEENAEYIIQGDTLKEIATQVQRLLETDATMTATQMEAHLRNVTKGSDLSIAEECAFGTAEAAISMGITEFGTPVNRSTMYYYGWKFTAAQACSIVNFCAAVSTTVSLWDGSGNFILNNIDCRTVGDDGWYYTNLEEPIKLVAGSEYTFAIWAKGDVGVLLSGTTVGPLFANASMAYGKTFGSCPTNYGFYGGMVNAILSVDSEEIPGTLQISTSTLDAIAEEVQRIAGATEKMSTAQIITALQGIT